MAEISSIMNAQTNPRLELIGKVDKMETPAHLGRIPQNIGSIGSLFTADQWRNWVRIYSLYALHGILPSVDYECILLFVACFNLPILLRLKHS